MKRVSALWTNDKIRSECRIQGNSDPSIGNVSFHSAQCVPNSAFVAIKGIHEDGHDHIGQAVANGAVAVIHEKPLSMPPSPGILYIRHPHPRRVASLFARGLAGSLPSRIIGVTGTDGKSTTCDFLWQLLNRCGIRCALLSSVSMDDGSLVRPSPHRQSTPEVPELYAFLSSCAQNGVDTVVLEATSHGLSEQASRLADITFAGAVYTTLTSEHMEYHRTLEAYAQAKLNLARQVDESGWIVLPHDFPRFGEIALAKHPQVPMSTYSLDCDDSQSDLRAHTSASTLATRTITFETSGEPTMGLELPYGQACYAKNVLGAIIAAHLASGLGMKRVIDLAQGLHRVAGRFEIVAMADPCTVVIDFAHTADAFGQLFSHVRSHMKEGRIIAVFGAAGERDTSKRFPMGAAAGRWCDVVYLTDEDPRKEHPDAILDELHRGIESTSSDCRVHRINDRTRAIEAAIAEAHACDVVLLLAKGHERTIQYDDRVRSWNERQVAEAAVSSRRGAFHA